MLKVTEHVWRVAMKWTNLSGEERYRVVEMARKGDVPLTEICKNFGVSRQTLYRAMHKADEASALALEPKRPGRKSKTPDEQAVTELNGQVEGLQKEMEQWRTKYEVAKAFLDLERKYDRGEPLDTTSSGAEKKRRRKKKAKKRRKT
jgi:transposase-like protein